MRVLCVFGTRPEAIKMAPVVQALEKQANVECRSCVTGQHREMLDQMLEHFDVSPHYDLNLMQPGQTPSAFAAKLLETIPPVLTDFRPDWLVVQGDTTTAMAAGLAAMFHKVNIAHVEAGLRTQNRRNPFPEEMNRRLLGTMADLHFAPTAKAASALLGEGHDKGHIFTTGNTGIDALEWTRRALAEGTRKPTPEFSALGHDQTLVLVTTHRRESFDGGIENICMAVTEIAARHPQAVFILPVHPNPAVEQTVRRILSGSPNVQLVKPMDYASFVWLMERAALIMSDSGGIQEEATFLGKPLLIMRETTERSEAVENGNAELVGTQRQQIVSHALAVLENPAKQTSMAIPSHVFGDGHAAERIADILAQPHRK